MSDAAKFLLIALVIISVVVAAKFLSPIFYQQLRIDDCLDGGGAWNAQRQTCETG